MSLVKGNVCTNEHLGIIIGVLRWQETFYLLPHLRGGENGMLPQKIKKDSDQL